MYTKKPLKYIGIGWALFGFSVLIVFAISRLFINFQDVRVISLTATQEVALVAWTGMMLYAEGYRGFQKKFSPRFATRALYLCKSGTTKDIILAPLFCMGFFRATPQQIIRTWTLTAVIILFVILAGVAPSPWRGIISGGVMIGLAYGLGTVWLFTISAIRSGATLTNEEVV